MTDPAETAEITSPIAWQRWLSIQLVRLRKAAGVRQAEAAKAIGASVGKLSYLENGDRPISVDELEKLLPLYRVPDADRVRCLQAAAKAGEPGWWDEWSEEDLPRESRRYVGLEDGATRIREYAPAVVPGLLQTADYARAVVTGAARGVSPEVVERQVELRIARQRALTRARRPLSLDTVLDESTLHRQVGGPRVLSQQLETLARLSDEHPNVSIRVLPYSVGSHPAIFGPFSLLGFDLPGDPGLVFIEGEPTTDYYVETRAEVYAYSARFHDLAEVALDEAESLSLIRHLAREIS